MQINLNSAIPATEVQMDGALDLTMRMLIGPKDGSNNVFMRLFHVRPGGHTPYHIHNYEHVVKAEKGKGIIVDEKGREHEISEGQSVFVSPNEKHQFKNPFAEPFEFLCVIPNPDK